MLAILIFFKKMYHIYDHYSTFYLLSSLLIQIFFQNFCFLPHDQNLLVLQTHHDLSIVRMSTVPAPPEPDEPELKYLDLDLETHGDQSRSPPIPHTTSATTEYREIDFIKTQALQDVKTLRQNKNK